MGDLILFNANVITMNPMLPRAEAVAIRKEQIAAVGGNRELEKLKSAEARILDCKGRTLLPGFIDAHCHIHAYAESLVSLSLSPLGNIRSISDIQNRIRSYCKSAPPGSWIRAKALNEFYLSERRLPTRRDLDPAAPHHPVKITHRSGHAHILNSLALKLAGIGDESGDPPGGMIDRDPESGLPTGILYGMGGYLAGKIPSLDDAGMEKGFALANSKLLSYGITSVQDVSYANGLREWERFGYLKERGILQPRVTMALGWKSFAESRREFFHSPVDKTGLRLGGVKIIADQVSGSLYPAQEELARQVSAIHEAGLQAIIHAVEEPVIRAACDAVDYALNRHAREDARHRIEHCSVCPPSLLGKLANIGIAVVTQPSFIYYSGDRYLETVRRNQLEHLYAIGTMLKKRLPVAFGSDFPISDPNPMPGIYAAVTRRTEGNQKLIPEQGIRVSNAIRMQTLSAAAAAFEEDFKGSITPGKAADLVMLSADPFTVPVEELRDIGVIMTMIGGRIAWDKIGIA
jgi:predicted amidohydrolase YtcJ